MSAIGSFLIHAEYRFGNGIEADLSAIVERRHIQRDDRELLVASTRVLRTAPNAPNASRGRITITVDNETVVLDGGTAFYFKRASAECAVQFLDKVSLSRKSCPITRGIR